MSKSAILIVFALLTVFGNSKTSFCNNPSTCNVCEGKGWTCDACHGTWQATCERCHGSKYDASSRCPGCHGTGRIERKNAKGEIKWRVCDACNGRRISRCIWCGGTGKVHCNSHHKTCEACNGTGKRSSYYLNNQ